ncbi:hypothetical protein [Costertonia aggregata]|uniref:Tfp pilus assembly protein, major pilin PilA n=1 Tax=Costertonia aggregata TaxID=343403 RepID=A0A7H9ATR9_9FLAO|nr:hypothetical protein [Costertonia aggregata]QLG46742.1 hypothetical protein HYG79_15745 [Costertonia aggregata]
MNIYFRTVLIILLTFQFNACLEIPSFGKKEELSVSEDFKTVKINDYSMAVPKYMKTATGLNPDASLQYQNIFKEAYVVVIDEPKDELKEVFEELNEWDDSKSVSENYRDIQLNFLEESITITKQMPAKAMKINGLDAQVVDVDGKVDGIMYEIAYTIAFVEGNENVYMIMAWTLKDKREKTKNTYAQIINSFELTE